MICMSRKERGSIVVLGVECLLSEIEDPGLILANAKVRMTFHIITFELNSSRTWGWSPHHCLFIYNMLHHCKSFYPSSLFLLNSVCKLYTNSISLSLILCTILFNWSRSIPLRSAASRLANTALALSEADKISTITAINKIVVATVNTRTINVLASD